LETYTIPGEPGERTVCLNGPAARLAATGDQVIVISYAEMTPEEAESHEPNVVLVDENNEPKEEVDLDAQDDTPDVPDDVGNDVLIA
jgi:aspartate 1-decarboxylase